MRRHSWRFWNSTPPRSPPLGSKNATEFITFIDGEDAVTPPALPAYDGANHTYHFVLDIQDTLTLLTFGVNDGNLSDNSGQYNIDVFQVEAATSPVPEPASLALLGVAAITLCGYRAGRRWRTRPEM